MGDALTSATEKICRLCLSSEDKNLTKLEASAIGKLKAIIPELTVQFSSDSVVCSKCLNLTDKGFELKKTLSKNNELIENERQKQNSQSIDLASIVKSASLGENICRICLQHNKSEYVSLTDNVDEQFNEVLNDCIPELNKYVTTKPIICSLCNAQLFEMYEFKKNCLSVQERIQSCYNFASPTDIDFKALVVLKEEKEYDFLSGFEVQDEEADIFDDIVSSDTDSHKRTNSEPASDEIQLKRPKLVASVAPESGTNKTPKSTVNEIFSEELPFFQFNYNLLHNPDEVDMELEDWLAQVEQYKTKYGWSDLTTIHKVLVKLKEINVLHIWFSNIASIMSWEQWKKKLIRAFPVKSDYHVRVNKMMKRTKLQEETYVSYYMHKLKLMESLHLTDKQKISCLFGGITDILVCCVGRVGDYTTPESLLDYFKSCDEKELVNAETKKGNNAETKKGNNVDTNTAYSKFLKPGKATSTERCAYCSKLGHTVRACRFAKAAGYSGPVQSKVVTDGSYWPGTSGSSSAEILEGSNTFRHYPTAYQHQEEDNLVHQDLLLPTLGGQVDANSILIQRKVVGNWKKIANRGLVNEERIKLKQKYRIPINAPLLGVPKLNPVIKPKMSEYIMSTDHRRRMIQEQISSGLSAIGTVISQLLKEENGNKQYIEHLSDAGRLLADSHFYETYTRRQTVLNCVDKDLKATLSQLPWDGWLFGEDLEERLTDAQRLQLKTFRKIFADKPPVNYEVSSSISYMEETPDGRYLPGSSGY